jgi:hypothetical protein
VKVFPISVGLAIAIIALSGWCLGSQSGDAIHLRETVEVNHEIVLLSDLLPTDAPTLIWKAGATLELCRAPQPGSVRILRAEQILASIASREDLVQQLVMPARVTIRYYGWPIKEANVRDAIAEFLRNHGSDGALPDNATLVLPESLAANEKDFQLQVTHMQWDVQRQAIEVRLRCSRRWSCGSFLARAVFAEPLAELWRNGLPRAMSVDSTRHPETAPDPGYPLLVARGKPATLILDNAMTRISMPVICLEPGGLKQRIRVFDKRSRQVFLAEVVGDHLLHASL